jgi:hypothetical protein
VHVQVRPNGYVTQVNYSQGRDEYRGRGHKYGHRKHHDRNYW